MAPLLLRAAIKIPHAMQPLVKILWPLVIRISISVVRAIMNDLKESYICRCNKIQDFFVRVLDKTKMWHNAQRDGRPAEHRWHPLLNAAKFGLLAREIVGSPLIFQTNNWCGLGLQINHTILIDYVII